MSRTRNTLIRGYIHLPRGIRRHTDKIVGNREIRRSFKERQEKGKQLIKKKLKRAVLGVRKRRRRR